MSFSRIEQRLDREEEEAREIRGALTIDSIIRYEEGDLTDEETITLFQRLINSGAVWTLQGSYGRQALRFLNAGLCKPRRA